jgi:molecular chaperone GrpE (heat shock protein)
VKAFTEVLQRANDNEKATLRLELDKLRRGESDSVQVVVRLLDHVHALHAGAVRSAQPRLVEQISNFQSACHDAVRRIGLTPFAANAEEPFDPQRHQLVDVEAKPESGAVVSETVAAGYNLQGRLLRPALVRLREENGQVKAKAAKAEAAEAEKDQSQLPLEVAAAEG